MGGPKRLRRGGLVWNLLSCTPPFFCGESRQEQVRDSTITSFFTAKKNLMRGPSREEQGSSVGNHVPHLYVLGWAWGSGAIWSFEDFFLIFWGVSKQDKHRFRYSQIESCSWFRPLLILPFHIFWPIAHFALHTNHFDLNATSISSILFFIKMNPPLLGSFIFIYKLQFIQEFCNAQGGPSGFYLFYSILYKN